MRKYPEIRKLLILLPIIFGLIMGLFGTGSAETLTYTYDSNGQIIKVDYGNGNSTTYTYDEAGNILTKVTTGTAQQYTLTVSRSGTGSGTVTSSPAGINCGSGCSAIYNQGTVVTLTATASAGSTFQGWSGGCSGSGTCSVTMNANITVTANSQAQGSPTLNLTPYQPQGWSDKIVVTTTQGSTTDSGPLNPTDTLYVDWAVINQGPAATAVRFCNNLYVDGAEKGPWCSDPPINANIYIQLKGFPIGSLTAGTHKIKVVADSTGAISENSESDNEYTKTIKVGGSQNGPDLTGEWTSVSQSCKTTSKGKSCKLSASLKVQNKGNRDASSSYVAISLSSPDFNQPDTLVKRLSTGKLKAGASKTLKIAYSLPTGQSASGKDLYAAIDADGMVDESDENNNLILYTVP